MGSVVVMVVVMTAGLLDLGEGLLGGGEVSRLQGLAKSGEGTLTSSVLGPCG